MHQSGDDRVRVLFLACGSDERILSLGPLLGCRWEGRPIRAGETTPDGTCPEQNHGTVLIVSEDAQDGEHVEQLIHWLEGNAEVIFDLDGEKTVEFETILPSGHGSHILLIPQEVVDLCSRLGCRIAHQCIRVPSDKELAAHRKKSN